MILIDTKTVDGIIYPAQEIPADCIAKIYNGGQYICYQKGDIVPAIDYNDHPLDLSIDKDLNEGIFQKILPADLQQIDYYNHLKQYLANHPEFLPLPNLIK